MSAPRRWLADGPLALLMVVGATFVAAMVAFVLRHGMAYDPLVTCQTMVSTLVARLSTLGVLLPAGLVTAIGVAAALSMVHQLVATRRMLGGLMRRVVPLDARLSRLSELAGLRGRLDLVPDDAAYTFCHGLRRPRVCVSTALVALLDDAELVAVLRHEAHHARYGDPFKILIGRAVASGLFFLPLAGALRNAFLAGKEICADRHAATDGDPLPLARALVKLVEAERPRWPAGVLAIGALSPTEARILQLVEPGEPARLLPRAGDWIVSAAVVAGIFGFGYGSLAARGAEPVEDACQPVVAVVAEASRPAAVIQAPCVLRSRPLKSAALLRPPGRYDDC